MNPKVALAAAAALMMFAITQTSSTAHNEMPGLGTSPGASSEQAEPR